LNLHVLLPARGFLNAKQRLATVLPADARRTLARNLFDHVLRTLDGCIAAERILVLTDSPEVAAIAERFGADFRFDADSDIVGSVGGTGSIDSGGAPNHLGPTVDAGLALLRARGATHALALMSDLPLLERDELKQLLRALESRDVVIAPDRHHAGTNALGFRLDALPHACFGHDDSYQRHLRLAEAHGATVRKLRAPGLGLDLDTAEDLLHYATLMPHMGAPRIAGIGGALAASYD
jgi:2-phospho-L-lactate/phosphoenolpyruvate guanylyltransferase